MGLSHWSSAPPSSSFSMHAFNLLLWCGFLVTSVLGGNNETDRLALLEFKAKITLDPFGVMSSWNDSIHFCQWRGVTCGRRHQRVTMLGPAISETVQIGCPVQFLLQSSIYLHWKVFDVGINQIQGRLPSDIASLGSCVKLEYLAMRRNLFQGIIPPSLRSLRGLEILDLSDNNLSGQIPKFLEQFVFLQLLNLSHNHFEGEVPTNGVFKNTSATLIMANGELCGGIPKFQLPKYIQVAVKVLNLLRHGASKSFKAECEALRNIRHRNLVKVLTSCSGIDYQGGLSLLQRLNIAIDVANALDYLHHHCQTPIVHCDLKPSNVLLDDEMIGHVGDFGLARFLFDATQDSSIDQSSSIGVRGTVGYTPPEYGLGNEVSTYGDVYSYGILLLEMFTGKRPTDNVFQDCLNLHDFVKAALSTRITDIIDPILFWEREEGETTMNDITRNEGQNGILKSHECLISILEVGVACSVEFPRERMNMSAVIIQLHSIRQKLIGTNIRRQRLQATAPPSSSFSMHAFNLLLWCAFLVTSVLGGNNETDRLALLEFKAKITLDPFGVMSSWNDSIHFCQWRGVTCGRRHQRVTVLDL
uniref:non-specific serine/threonine protein kinase n=1 Tax=Fagus sylvatica TaxID=28930 RepID=A0A2N9G8F3_FAGSY